MTAPMDSPSTQEAFDKSPSPSDRSLSRGAGQDRSAKPKRHYFRNLRQIVHSLTGKPHQEIRGVDIAAELRTIPEPPVAPLASPAGADGERGEVEDSEETSAPDAHVVRAKLLSTSSQLSDFGQTLKTTTAIPASASFSSSSSSYSAEDDQDDMDTPFTSGYYTALYHFKAEGPAEMDLEEDQVVSCLGRGGGLGWVVALKTIDHSDGEPELALVPERYLEFLRPYEDAELRKFLGQLALPETDSDPGDSSEQKNQGPTTGDPKAFLTVEMLPPKEREGASPSNDSGRASKLPTELLDVGRFQTYVFEQDWCLVPSSSRRWRERGRLRSSTEMVTTAAHLRTTTNRTSIQKPSLLLTTGPYIPSSQRARGRWLSKRAKKSDA